MKRSQTFVKRRHKYGKWKLGTFRAHSSFNYRFLKPFVVFLQKSSQLQAEKFSVCTTIAFTRTVTKRKFQTYYRYFFLQLGLQNMIFIEEPFTAVRIWKCSTKLKDHLPYHAPMADSPKVELQSISCGWKGMRLLRCPSKYSRSLLITCVFLSL